MIKSEKNLTYNSEQPTYPYLASFMTTKERDKSFVVLFLCYGNGVVVWSDDPIRKIGYCSVNWDMTSFIPYEGKITISNS
jgi:hypothetical protein